MKFEEIENRIRHVCELHEADRIFVVTDSVVSSLVEGLLPEAPRIVIEAGEGSKNLRSAETIWEFLIEEGALRRSAVVNIGGGMISDLGGFAAATFKRGIGYVNVPTTLLAAVDASVGGKTGINFAGLKNEVGAFALPWAIFPLTSLFHSLSEEEWLSGVGEVLKTALLISESFFRLASSEDFIIKRKTSVVDEVVNRCADFKNSIVRQDFRESGKRRILNLGHTAGHSIESWKMAHGLQIPHGIAVAHGLRYTLERSVSILGMPHSVLIDYIAVLEKYFPPLEMSETQLKEAWHYMDHDKKITASGCIPWVLLKDFGQPVY